MSDAAPLGRPTAPTSTSAPAAQDPPEPSPAQQAATMLSSLRKQMTEAMIQHIVENEDRYSEVDPDERYNFSLQELDERFLAKIGTIRRALAEVYALPGMSATTTNAVTHVRVTNSQDIGEQLSKTIKSLGRVTIVDVAATRGPDGYDLVVTYQATKRPDVTPSQG